MHNIMLLFNCNSRSTDVYAVPCGCSYPARAGVTADSKDAFHRSPQVQFLLLGPALQDGDNIFHAG